MSDVCGKVVCGDTVEQASWRKSGCECKCRFPNTRGLHRTSGDAPLEIHHSPHPPWGHVHKYNFPSLIRTKLVAVASRHKKREFTSHSTKDKKDETACKTCVDNVVCGHAVEQALGGSLDVNASVSSQTPEDFTTHPEMHPLKHIIHFIRHGVTCISLTLRLLE